MRVVLGRSPWHQVNGTRYLDYPAKDTCCDCCSAAQGCGVLRPDWLNNATFVGHEVRHGVNATKWDKKGLQSNFYWERTSDRRPLEIDQTPNDDQSFDVGSYAAAVDPSVFELPARCAGAGKCSLLSLCRAVG